MKTSALLHALNDATLETFVDDTTPFEACSNECFDTLDVDGDGALSREELRSGFGSVLPGIGYLSEPKEELDGLHVDIFKRFDADGNGVVDRGEFKDLLREIMLGVARGIGGSPVLVALEDGSLLIWAVQHEHDTKKG